jgi:hypothetical protein
MHVTGMVDWEAIDCLSHSFHSTTDLVRSAQQALLSKQLAELTHIAPHSLAAAQFCSPPIATLCHMHAVAA